MKNITIENLVRVCGGVLHGAEYADSLIEAEGVVIDSRQVQKAGVFVAIKGEKTDGHNYVNQVFEKGALACICMELPPTIIGPVILVENTLDALKKIALFYRNTIDVPVVGITGSVGKTTTKEIIGSCLSAKYNVTKTKGNFNNEIGMPLTILQAKEDTEVLVLEMGINHFGEMDRLSSIARPDIMVITNIGNCHLEFLENKEGVLRAKTECFKNLNKNATVILNGDDKYLSSVQSVEGADLLFFGENNDYEGEIKEDFGIDGLGLKIKSKISGMEIQLRLAVPGNHNLSNALAAFAVAEKLGMTPEEIKSGLEMAGPITGRSCVYRLPDYILIDDSYNASPKAMMDALELLSKSQGRKVAVLGDMFELGEKEEELHASVGKYINTTNIDVVITIGRLSSYINKELPLNMEKYHFENIDMEKIMCLINRNDTILIKASHGMDFNKIVDFLKENVLND